MNIFISIIEALCV